VRSKFFVALIQISLFHFIERFANERVGWLKLPPALGTSKAAKMLVANPFQPAWHRGIIRLHCAKVNSVRLLVCQKHLPTKTLNVVELSKKGNLKCAKWGCTPSCPVPG
jgi:hypothetical protein